MSLFLRNTSFRTALPRLILSDGEDYNKCFCRYSCSLPNSLITELLAVRALWLSCSAWARGQGWLRFSQGWLRFSQGSTSSKDGASTACLDSPSQAWTSFLGRILFLIFNLEFPSSSFMAPVLLFYYLALQHLPQPLQGAVGCSWGSPPSPPSPA